MKIRNGFVSNSSSSSFVVVFQKKPKTVDDVATEMFPKSIDEVTQPYDFIDPTPNRQIAERVFNDLKGKRFKKSELISEFESRYYYFGDDNHSDNPLVQELISQERKLEEASKESDKQLKQLLINAGIVEMPYAWIGGKKYPSGEPYTEEDVKKYNKYVKQSTRFKETNEEYKKLEMEHWKIYHSIYRKINSIRHKLATVDAEKFLKEHKGKYVVVLTYGDENGDSNMEHGDIFRNMDYVQFSHH